MIYLNETMTAELQTQATRMHRAADAIEATIARAELIRAMGIEKHQGVWAVLPGTLGQGDKGDDLSGVAYDRWDARQKSLVDLTMAELKTINRYGVSRFTWFD